MQSVGKQGYPLECPFYKTSGESSVYCNGFAVGINVKFYFDDKKACRKWVKNVCRNREHCGFGICPYFLLLEQLCDIGK